MLQASDDGPIDPEEAQKQLTELEELRKQAREEQRSLPIRLKQLIKARAGLLVDGATDGVLDDNLDRIERLKQRETDMGLMLEEIDRRIRFIKSRTREPARRSSRRG